MATICRAVDVERADWEALYRGYATFYRVPMTDRILSSVWAWLNDPDHEVEGFVAVADNRPVGLVHYRAFARPLAGETGLYMDDLFVHPDARGAGHGRALIEAVAGQARMRNVKLIRWITADDNHRARALYDTLATATRWFTYDMAVT